MDGQQINRVSSKVILVLSLTALLTVLIGYTQPPQPDEGALAHIFQLAIVLLVPMILLFLGTADWKQPLRSVQRLAFPAVALVLAFAALYYLEHYRYTTLFFWLVTLPSEVLSLRTSCTATATWKHTW